MDRVLASPQFTNPPPLPLILITPLSKSRVQSRKRKKGASFPSTTSNWPLYLAWTWRNRGEERELGAGDGAGHLAKSELQAL